LNYHIVDGLYPNLRVLRSQTIPTLYTPDTLNGPQRFSVRFSLRGAVLNFYSHFVVSNIPASNGLIHGIDSILVPPPPTTAILKLLPGTFSTLSLGLSETGLLPDLEQSTHVGSTFFAPSNTAFKKLGPRINAFLFSPPGLKYLKALLQYHVVHNQTLYTDAFYGPQHESGASHFHVDLPTLLEGKHLSIDVGRWGPFVGIRINGFAHVTTTNGVVKDGVVQGVGRVLIPPKSPKSEDQGYWMGEEMEVEELMERLSPFVEDQTVNFEL